MLKERYFDLIPYFVATWDINNQTPFKYVKVTGFVLNGYTVK